MLVDLWSAGSCAEADGVHQDTVFGPVASLVLHQHLQQRLEGIIAGFISIVLAVTSVVAVLTAAVAVLTAAVVVVTGDYSIGYKGLHQQLQGIIETVKGDNTQRLQYK